MDAASLNGSRTVDIRIGIPRKFYLGSRSSLHSKVELMCAWPEVQECSLKHRRPISRGATDADKVAAIVAARAIGTGVRRIGRELGVGVGTVLRLTGEAALVRRLTGQPAPDRGEP
jgi:hypothetical protein